MKPVPTIIAAVLAGACALVFAAPTEAPAGYADAHKQFVAGANGDAKAREASIEAFRALAKNHPEHPLLSAYEGAAIAMQARDALAPWDKLQFAEKGANLIEKALAQLTTAHDATLFDGTPESIQTRLMAADTLLALPGFMNRGGAGKRALEAALASPALARATPAVRARLEQIAARFK